MIHQSRLHEWEGEWVPEVGTPAYIETHSLRAMSAMLWALPANLTYLNALERTRAIASHLSPSDEEPGSRRYAWHPDLKEKPRYDGYKYHWTGATRCVNAKRQHGGGEYLLDGAGISERMEAEPVSVCKACAWAFQNA